MTQRIRFLMRGPFGLLVLMTFLLAGCAKQLPLAPGVPEGDRAGVAPGSQTAPSAGAGGQQPSVGGRLDERDRSGTEGRMSGQEAPVLDPAAEREAFLNEDILFAYNSFALTDESKELLARKVAWMERHPSVTVQLEGHCDERGTVAYNLALGERRANAVRQYMAALGISPSRMTTISYGEEFPIDPRHNDEAWARNRRAHFAILNP